MSKKKSIAKTALFPGTFDPPSLGHLDIIQRASKICDKLYIGVAKNIRKVPALFSVEERIKLLKTITKSLPYVEIISFNGLVIDWAAENNVDFLLRGLRAFSDFEMEFQMALANKKMSNMETVFLMSDSNFSHISSSLIREIASFGHDLHDFVPAEFEDMIRKRVKQNKSKQ